MPAREKVPERALVRVPGQEQADSPDDQEPEYDPGWLGTVLRWPIRIVAILVILPLQVTWESLKASARFTWKVLRPIARVAVPPVRFSGRIAGRAVRLVGRGLLKVARGARVPLRGLRSLFKACVRGTARVLWPVFYHSVRLTVRALKGIARVVALAAGGVAVIGRALANGSKTIWAASGPTIVKLLRLLHQGVIFVLALCLVPPLWILRVLWRLYRRARPWLARVAALLRRWLIGLGHVVAEGVAVGVRVGRKVGRGAVWLWTVAVWKPLRHLAGGLWEGAKWTGRGFRRAWLAVWRRMARTWRRVTRPALRFLATCAGITRAITGKAMANVKAIAGRARSWYRREVSQPVVAAVRSTRRDIRRALTGKGRAR